MLAASTAVAYHVSASLRAEAWLAAVFPYPVVLAGGRWGRDASLHTLGLTSLLLLTVAGPVRCTSYVCTHGMTGVAIALCWCMRMPWVASIPLSAVARSVGTLLNVCITSALVRANLLRMALTQASSLLERVAPTVQPSEGMLAFVMVIALLLNGFISSFLLHVIFCALTSASNVPESYANPPRFIQNSLLSSRR